jgi:diaminopimelate epimerase
VIVTDLPFYKMNGIGNSILVVDTRTVDASLTPEAVRRIARHEPFDQLMAIARPRRDGTDAFVEIFNHDGSRAGACGNGTRCVAWALSQDRSASRIVIETAGGALICDRLGPTRFAVDMGQPRLEWEAIPLAMPVPDTSSVALSGADRLPEAMRLVSGVGMGNPHAVLFVADAAAVDLAGFGPLIEHDAMFPERANVSFAEVIGRAAIRLRVWERSAGATLACGSAACATLVAAVRAGLTDRDATVSLPGGDLVVSWRAVDDHVIMAGETELEHHGRLTPALWSPIA